MPDHCLLFVTGFNGIGGSRSHLEFRTPQQSWCVNAFFARHFFLKTTPVAIASDIFRGVGPSHNALCKLSNPTP